MHGRGIIFRRPTRLALLTFFTLWFVVFVPGHVRGQLTLSGERCDQRSHAVASDDNECCSRDDAGDSDPSPADVKQCAVCHYVLGLTLPPTFSFDPPKPELLAIKAIAWSEQVRSTKKFDPFHSRGPPTA